MKKGFLIALFFLIILCFADLGVISVGSDDQKGAPEICYSCFWEYQQPELKEMLIAFYKGYKSDDFFLKGEVASMLGNITGDASLIQDSAAFYNLALAKEKDPFRKMLLNEIMGMLAPRVSLDPSVYFMEASKIAGELGMRWRSTIMASLARGESAPQFGDVKIVQKLSVPPKAKYFILGESSIKVKREARVGIQLERTYRDWLSSQFRYDFSESYPTLKNILDYHEGARLGELMEYAGVCPVVLAGTLLAYREDKWYAPDENGVFRFQMLNDKVQYPTTKQYKNIALMIDTHGISAIVEQAIRENVDLVIACGDNPPKALAAYYLSGKGIPVYFPCDREIGMLVGHDGKAAILGTAPIKKADDGAVIGDQPVRFSIGEKIVIQDIERDSSARYYDTASRYFRALNSFVPLDLYPVKISGERETYKVTEAAEKIGAKAIGVRVMYEEDYDAVKKWLLKSKENRAVLFHSAPYIPGYRLFSEFPAQVTFGDPKPRFIAAD